MEINNVGSKIIKIEEVEIKGEKRWLGHEGYQIITDDYVLQLLINNYQDGSESWGYMASEDDLDEFIGATILSMKITNDELENKLIDINILDFEAGGAVFITLETTKGILQFVLYNEHNGFYGHTVVVNKIETTELFIDGV